SGKVETGFPKRSCSIKTLERNRFDCALSQTSLYVARFPQRRSRVVRALRLAVQDAALSRRKHGFDSRRARQYSRRAQRLMFAPSKSVGYGSISTPGLSKACGSKVAFAAFSAAANNGGRWRSYQGRWS